MSDKVLITITIPVLDEETNVTPLLKRLDQLASDNPRYDFEFLFTDNHSGDRTFELLADAAEKDPRVRVLRFSRNFGFQKSILANFLNARGAAAVQIDADLQDPPELITEFLARWEQGYKVVYGIRRKRQEIGLINPLRKMYYRLVANLSDVPLPIDAGDFRLIDRTIIEHLRCFSDQSPYLRGMIASLGYPQTGVPYDRSKRTAGHTKFSLGQLVQLSIDGICSQSAKPLRYITYFGLITSSLSAAAALAYVIWHMSAGTVTTPGFTTIVVLILLQTGVTTAFLGILGEYLGRVFANVRGAPQVIIDQRIEPLGSSPGDRASGPDKT